MLTTSRRRGGQEPFAQPLGDNKIRHVIQRECAFEAIFGEPAVGKHCPCVIDQDIDPRFLAGHFGGHALHLGNAGQIGVIDRVAKVWRPLVKPRQGRLSAQLVPRDQDDPGAHLRKPFRGNLANPRGAAGNDHRLALHRNSPYRVRRQSIAGPKNQPDSAIHAASTSAAGPRRS